MAQRLVLCFDGTWNKPDTNADVLKRVETNVCRFYDSVVTGAVGPDLAQNKWYDTGVGTNWYDRVAGGAFGLGIDQKIQEGYQWLAARYNDGDQVYVTGFSRGAYTARSLVGMIRNIGLLLPENAHRVEEAYAIYRQRGTGAGGVDATQAQNFRDKFSQEIPIQFLGVWDTVGALGIPIPALQWLNADDYAFHDTELSGIVANAAHAVAIDEKRIDYQVTLWAPIEKPAQKVEQRWFIGAHADVGGGYAARELSDITLAWMQKKAAEAGLAIDPESIPAVGDNNWKLNPTDSYGQFLSGVYAKTHEPFYRPMQLGKGLNEILDDTVKKRIETDPKYKPQNPGFEV